MGSGARVGASDVIDGLATAAVVILAFMAFDDITTDKAASFNVEYACLLACGGWIAALVVRLTRRGRAVLASLCAGLLLAALRGQGGIGPGVRPSWQPEYVATIAALIGMLLVAGFLVASGVRSTPTGPQ